MIPYFFFLFAAPCLGETLPDRGRHPFDNAIPFSCVPPSYLVPCRALAFPPRFLYNKEAAIFSIVSVIFFCTFQKDTMKARRIWYAKPCSVSRVPSLSGGNHLDPDQRQMEGSDPARPDAGHQTLWGAEKVHRHRHPEGPHRPAAADGGQRTAHPHRLRGGSPPAWSTPSPTWGAASGLFWTPWKPGEKPTKKMPADAGVFSLNAPLLSDQ